MLILTFQNPFVLNFKRNRQDNISNSNSKVTLKRGSDVFQLLVIIKFSLFHPPASTRKHQKRNDRLSQNLILAIRKFELKQTISAFSLNKFYQDIFYLSEMFFTSCSCIFLWLTRSDCPSSLATENKEMARNHQTYQPLKLTMHPISHLFDQVILIYVIILSIGPSLQNPSTDSSFLPNNDTLKCLNDKIIKGPTSSPFAPLNFAALATQTWDVM